MIRKDREICDCEEKIAVLKKCDTLCLGFKGKEYPYIVPVSFGVIQRDGVIFIYFHCAKNGCKIDNIENNPKVCVEGHVFYKVEPTHYGITARYESIIGFGTVQKVEGDEMVVGLKSMIEHYNYPNYPIDRCKGLQMTAVYRIKIDKLTGKRNLPE